MPSLVVRSHVARDLLQTAGLFSDVPKAVWEYVVNGLQYVNEGTNPCIRISVHEKTREITIIDNGRGMNLSGLENYFVMHGENQDARSGKGGRGRFGTGKSAAFGIAKCLTITTIYDNKMSRVRLKHADIVSQASGSNIPIEVLKAEEPSKLESGTIILISDTFVKPDEKKISAYIERQLGHYKRNVRVYVNEKECVVSEPPVEAVDVFRFQPTTAQRLCLGDVELVVKISKVFLEEPMRGIAIYSNENFYESRPVRENSYIFGSLDVPRLDTDHSDPPPFDSSRSLNLNPNNLLVSAIHDFVDEHVKTIAHKFAERRKQESETKLARQLEEHAKEISATLNRDFETVKAKVPERISEAVGGLPSTGGGRPDSSGSSFVLKGGNEIPTEPTPLRRSTDRQRQPRGSSTKSNTVLPFPRRPGGSESNGKLGEQPAIPGPTDGGFSVKYEHMGKDSDRSKFVAENRTIFINLDHPQIENALGARSPESPEFRRLAVEVAFSRYAVALVTEMVGVEGNFLDLIDPIDFVSETMERLARNGAALWTK